MGDKKNILVDADVHRRLNQFRIDSNVRTLGAAVALALERLSGR